MPTEKQILANRRNAQLSTGPRTEPGKRVSSLNAYRHGLTGQIEVLNPEEQSIHDKFCSRIVDSLNPADALERQLARSVAEGHWRLNRIRTIENNMFALASHIGADADGFAPTELEQAAAMANTFVDQAPNLQLLTTYEMRIHRKTRADLQQLKELQIARRADEEQRQAKENSDRTRQPSVAKPVDPSRPVVQPANGFVFLTSRTSG